MKNIKELLPYVIIILIVVIIRTFIVTPVKVDGVSMFPTLNNNQILLLEKFDKSLKRFDIVVLDYNKEKLVKRVIGLPGESILYKDNKLFINGKKIEEKFLVYEMQDFDLNDIGYNKIPDNYYFVVGDNRNNSLDSRKLGLISKDDIDGKIIYSIFPFSRFGKVE